jgi:hypothetical protein
MTVRLSWGLVFWGLLTSLSLNWVLPAFDHHAAEYSPFHTHQVVGASSVLRDALLAAHNHGAGHRHDHHASGPAPAGLPDPTVVSLSAFDGLLAVVAQVADLVLAPSLPLPLPPLAVWVTAGTVLILLLHLLSPPPEQPPRRAW